MAYEREGGYRHTTLMTPLYAAVAMPASWAALHGLSRLRVALVNLRETTRLIGSNNAGARPSRSPETAVRGCAGGHGACPGGHVRAQQIETKRISDTGIPEAWTFDPASGPHRAISSARSPTGAGRLSGRQESR